MKLSEFLNPAAVRIPLRSTSKEPAITELVTLLEASHGIDSDGEVLSRVLARESMLSTGIGHGVAVPHAKARAVKGVIASCGVAPDGLVYESLDGEPVRLLFLVVSPETERGPHVRALAAISRLMLDVAVRTTLTEALDPEAFWRHLLEAEQRLS